MNDIFGGALRTASILMRYDTGLAVSLFSYFQPTQNCLFTLSISIFWKYFEFFDKIYKNNWKRRMEIIIKSIWNLIEKSNSIYNEAIEGARNFEFLTVSSLFHIDYYYYHWIPIIISDWLKNDDLHRYILKYNWLMQKRFFLSVYQVLPRYFVAFIS